MRTSDRDENGKYIEGPFGMESAAIVRGRAGFLMGLQEPKDERTEKVDWKGGEAEKSTQGGPGVRRDTEGKGGGMKG